MRGRDRIMKKMDGVVHIIFGTVGLCVLKYGHWLIQ